MPVGTDFDTDDSAERLIRPPPDDEAHGEEGVAITRRVHAVHVLAGLVAFGLLLRLVTFSSWGIVYDGAVMSVMGESFALHGEFLLPYASVPTFYHHYPPLYPMFLSLFYRVLGFSIFATSASARSAGCA